MPTMRRSAAAATAALLVRLRWAVIGFWVLVAVVLQFALPPVQHGGGSSSLSGLVPSDTPAVQTELHEVELFGFPLTGRTAVVQHDPTGLGLGAQADAVTAAAAVTRGQEPALRTVRGALPLTNSVGLLPDSLQEDTTAVTYLLFDPDRSLTSQTNTAHRYVKRFFGPRDHVVGVTGSVPARAEQGTVIRRALPTVELSTLLAVLLIIGLALRSVVAPAIALLTAGVAYVVTLRVTELATHLIGVSAPSELEPVTVALLLGVATDYVVFFLTALRREVAAGSPRHEAARAAATRFGPIVLVAGLAVATGTGVLLLAHSGFFRALGPALAVTVLVTLVVAVTLVPALMAVLGSACFWPGRPRPSRPMRPDGEAARPGRRERFVAGVTATRRRAAVVVAACAAALALASWPALHLTLGVSLVGSLPADTGVRQAADAARAGIAPGILSPTTIVLEGAQVGARTDALQRLEGLLAAQDGVAGVIGPADLGPRLRRGVLVTRDDAAARLLVVLDAPALGGEAITRLDALQARLGGPDGLIAASGLPVGEGGVTVGVAGDTAGAASVVDQTTGDLLRIALAAVGANLVMLVLFLRALVAAPFLLVGSLLSLGAAIGLTSLVFEQVDPGAGLTFYVPFAAAVLLLAFGSDYNIYAVGSVWSESGTGSLRAALRTAMPEVMVAMLIAGLTLAASFGLLAIVPLLPFRQLALAMGLGIVIDVVVVRSLLLPAVLTLLGPVSAWPSRRFRAAAPTDAGATTLGG